MNAALPGLSCPVPLKDAAEDTLTRSRRVLGEDHPATQRSARSLAQDLRALGQA